MASLNDAERAREQTSELLRELGAHAISVEEEPAEAPDGGAPGGGVPARRHRRRRGFAVVAWFSEEPPATLPEHLEVRVGTRTKAVPLRARRSERFRAE